MKYVILAIILAITFSFTTFVIACRQQGMRGSAVLKAQPGQSCSVSPTDRGAHIACPDGTTTDIYNGTDGRDGLAAATVSVIQFCPGVTTYPGVFIEVGLCINDQLYAVYSANNGFLVYLPPGEYQSNAIGSTCTFTVTEGCNVVR